MGGREAGVTLIELMVTLTVFGILTMLALPAFSTWLANTRIRTAAEAVSNGLHLARTEAVRRNANIQIELGATGSTWTVSVVSSGEVLHARSVEEGTANTRVTVTPGASRIVTFDSLGRVTANTGGTAAITEVKVDTLLFADSEQRKLCVVIRPAGVARMCDPAVPATDTRRCHEVPAGGGAALVPAGCV